MFGTSITPLFTIISLVILAGLGELIHQPLVLPSLVATAAYIFGAPSIPGTQPRSVIGGHLISALLAFGLLTLFGSHPWVAILAAGIAFAAMNVVRLFHIPAVATAALIVMQHPRHASTFLVNIMLASLVLSLAGLFVSKTTNKLQYPLYW